MRAPHAVLRRAPGRCAGRAGSASASTRARPGYQIAQRSDFFEVEVGLETTLKRPIINTRDEPHAVADRYRRLHVILGDANHCDVANLLKMGTTSLVLAMIEADVIRDDLSVRRPVATLHEVSHDTTLQAKVELRRRPPDDGAASCSGGTTTGAAAFVEQQSGGEPDSDTAEVMHWWEHRARPSSDATRWRPAARSTGSPSSPCSRATASATASAGATRG